MPAKPTVMPDLKVRKQITAAALVKEIPLPAKQLDRPDNTIPTWAWSATLAPDERSLLVGSDGEIVVVDLVDATVRCVDVAAAHDERSGGSQRVTQIRFTPDHGRACVTTMGGKLAVLAWPSLEQLASYTITSESLHACAVLPDGASAWVGGHDCKRSRIDLATGKVLASQSGEWGWVSELALSPDGATLITSDAGTVIRFCDGLSGRERSQLELGIADNIIVGATEALIPNLYTAIVSLPDGKVLTKFEGEHKLGTSAAVYVGDAVVSVGSNDTLMVVWDRATGRPLLTMKPTKKGSFTSLVVVGDWLVTVPRYEAPLQVWRSAELVAAARSFAGDS